MLPSRESRALSPGKCLGLLDTVPVDRMVFTEGALPVVHPVNSLRHGSSVVLRTGPGTELDAARRGDTSRSRPTTSTPKRGRAGAC